MSRATGTLFFASVLISQVWGQNEPHPSPAIEFILDALDHHQAVGIGDLPGCEEAHNLIRSLIRSPGFPSKVDEIVVDFGNPIMQSTLDRYLLEGELAPNRLLRRVWDDTTRSVDLTWNSPVYEQFFDAVRSVNAGLDRAKRIRVVLADAPIDWSEVKHKDDLNLFEQRRSKTLADAVNAGIANGRRQLVITFPAQQFRTGEPDNARLMIEKEHPGKFFSIIVQGRFGPDATYRKTEARQGFWDFDTAAVIGGTWLGAVPVSAEPHAPTLESAVEAVLFVGRSDSLTIIRPSAHIFQDVEFWLELNRRWRIVRGMPFNLAAAGYDLRSRFQDPLPFMPSRSTPRAHRTSQPVVPAAPAKNQSVVSLADFIVHQIDQYPIIGLGDVHTCLEFHQAIHQLIRDPRLPGKVNDLIVEFGNPLFQTAIDRYVVDGSDVPRGNRKGAWENAAMGWAISGSPIYEAFFDLVREVNMQLPKAKRMRIVLGDAALNFASLREDPQSTLRQFVTSRSAPVSPARETALAASVHAALSANHRALVIAGSGHLRKGGFPGTARQHIDRLDPGKFFYLENVATASLDLPVGSVILDGENAKLFIGAVEFQTSIRVSPLIFRDPEFWRDINLISRFNTKEWIDLARPEFEYRGRYFEGDWPEFLRSVTAADRN